LGLAEVEHVEASLSRLTAAYAPTLALIRLLCGADGLSLEPAARAVPVSGFLFDMNRFFQRLLSRFLRENLGSRLEDERTIRDMLVYDPMANPRGARNPRLRPDYAVFKGSKLALFADAKYRDVWTKGTPVGWLYQLQAYAWASPTAVCVLLYASTESEAREERIIVRDPLLRARPSSAIVLRPVHLPTLADIVTRGNQSHLNARRSLARQLIWGDTAVPTLH
jgi:5-methylcytosine-specific restriction enzyme subunit McrC